eukprot:Colp12_sorted_trinity150504_noHs@16671
MARRDNAVNQNVAQPLQDINQRLDSIERSIGQLKRSERQIQEQIADLEERVEAGFQQMESAITRNTALIESIHAQRLNTSTMSLQGLTDAHRPLFELPKTTPGSFGKWPNQRRPRLVFVGAKPSDVGIPFPASVQNLNTLSALQLRKLAWFYNIDLGNNTERGRNRFRDFISGNPT